MKEEFKSFVRNNPQLANYVSNKKMTWQQFYELYDLYGADNSIWNNYLNNDNSHSTSNDQNSTVNSLKELWGLFKGIDLNTVQKALGSLEKAIGTFKDFNLGNKDTNVRTEDNYQERPMYKYFED